MLVGYTMCRNGSLQYRELAYTATYETDEKKNSMEKNKRFEKYKTKKKK